MRGQKVRVRKTLGLFFGQTALFVLAILAVCTATGLHTALLRAFDAADRSGIAPDEVEAIAHAMVAVMKGADRQILARWFTADEVLHMKDVQGLFSLGIKLFLCLAALAAVGLIGGKRPARREYRRALWLTLLVPAAVAIPFILNFNGMWVFLHRVAFPQNELWLMDPRMHKMVVVYSGEFFMAVVAVAGILCALSLAPLMVLMARTKEE